MYIMLQILKFFIWKEKPFEEICLVFEMVMGLLLCHSITQIVIVPSGSLLNWHVEREFYQAFQAKFDAEYNT